MKNKKRLRLKESVKNVLAILLLYLIIIAGVIAINARMGQLNNIEQTQINK